MLSFAEEIYLLALDEETGKIMIPSKETVLETAMIGAVLCELSLLKKIDTDQEFIYLLNSEPTGNPVLNVALDYIKRMNLDKYKIYHCIKILTPKAEEIEEKALEQLLEKNILKKVDKRILWLSPQRTYPVIDNREIKNVETRLKEIILSDEIPDPREAILISLVNACGLFGEILSPKEIKRYAERIENLSKLELIGKEVVRQIQHVKNEQ